MNFRLSPFRAGLRALSALLAGGCACNAFAAEVTEADFLDDLPVVLSVSRLSQPVNEAPAAVTVIDQDMIRASGFRDIPDLLRLVPGFSVAYTHDNTWAAGYHGLGDAYSRRFQVLVDGRSIYSAHYGAVNWGDLPLAIEDIERIEVIRGPNAAIHGANAFSAVINIITKTAAQVPGTLVSTQVGEQRMRGVLLRHGGGDAQLRYRFTVSNQRRDRFERDITGRTPGNGDNGQYFESSNVYFANGRLDWQLTSASDLSLQFGLSQGYNHAGRSTDRIPDTSLVEPRQQDSRAQYLQVNYHHVQSPQREWRIQAYHTRNRFDANVEGNVVVPIPPPFGGSFDFVVNQYLLQTRTNLEVQVNETWLDGLRGVWGGEVRYETVESPDNYTSKYDGVLGRLFGHVEWQAHPRLLLQTGAMLEHQYFTGADISPRVAASWTLRPGHVVRVGLSQAYRSPTFFEENSFSVLRITSGGMNRDDVRYFALSGLKPERVQSRELAYLGRWPSLHLEWDIRLYRDHISDFIGEKKGNFFTSDAPPGYDPSAPPGTPGDNEFRYENIGTVDTQGGEIQLRWRPSQQWDVSAHYARVYLDADTSVNNFNEDIPLSAPRNSWGLLTRYRFAGGWEASVGAWHYDDTKWLSEGDDVQNYTRIDARLARRWMWQGREVEAALVGQNLGEDYVEFRDTNVFSRRVYGSLSFAW